MLAWILFVKTSSSQNIHLASYCRYLLSILLSSWCWSFLSITVPFLSPLRDWVEMFTTFPVMKSFKSDALHGKEFLSCKGLFMCHHPIYTLAMTHMILLESSFFAKSNKLIWTFLFSEKNNQNKQLSWILFVEPPGSSQHPLCILLLLLGLCSLVLMAFGSYGVFFFSIKRQFFCCLLQEPSMPESCSPLNILRGL